MYPIRGENNVNTISVDGPLHLYKILRCLIQMLQKRWEFNEEDLQEGKYGGHPAMTIV